MPDDERRETQNEIFRDDTQHQIIVGLTIFRAHGGGRHVAADHDIFYAGQGDGQALSDEEILTLYQHGWDQDPCNGCAESETPDTDLAPINPSDSDVPEPEDRHLRTCSEWSICV